MLTLAGGPLYNQLVLQHFLTFKHAQKMAQQIASNSRFTDRDLLQLPYLYNQYLASDTNDVSYSAAIRPLLPNIYEAMEREGAQLKQAFEATRLMSQEKYSDGSFLDSEDHTYAERVLQLVRDIPEYLSLTRHLLQLQKQFPESPVPRSLLELADSLSPLKTEHLLASTDHNFFSAPNRWANVNTDVPTAQTYEDREKYDTHLIKRTQHMFSTLRDNMRTLYDPENPESISSVLNHELTTIPEAYRKNVENWLSSLHMELNGLGHDLNHLQNLSLPEKIGRAHV